MKVEVWYAVDEDGTQCLYTEKPKRYEDNINGWVNSDWGDKDELQKILIMHKYLKKIG